MTYDRNRIMQKYTIHVIGDSLQDDLQNRLKNAKL
jgi:hypothetical protein